MHAFSSCQWCPKEATLSHWAFVLAVSVAAGEAASFLNLETKLTAREPAVQRAFGSSVALSGDTLAVGAIADEDRFATGAAVYLFTRTESGWRQEQRLTASNAPLNFGVPLNFGISLGLHENTLVAGSLSDAAYVFLRNGANWVEQQILVGSDTVRADQFGLSVAISGGTIVVGANQNNRAAGAAYLFLRNGTTWTQQQKIIPSDPFPPRFFGYAVAIEDDTLVVGAPEATGAAYVFTRQPGGWNQQQRLLPSGGGAGDSFGSAVAISGDTIVVGSPGNDSTAFDAGASYVYVRSGGVWTQQQKLFPAASMTSQRFGWSVAIQGERIAVGAPELAATGTAYLFEREGGAWSLGQKLNASDGRAWDLFGSSVAVDDQTVVAGSPYAGPLGGASLDTGATYVYETDTQPPVITAIIPNPGILSPPNHRLRPVTLSVTATDASGVAVCRIISVASNEPPEASAPGHTGPDWEITGDLTLLLRAERSSQGTGRVYTITVECADKLGHTSRGTTTVLVPR